MVLVLSRASTSAVLPTDVEDRVCIPGCRRGRAATLVLYPGVVGGDCAVDSALRVPSKRRTAAGTGSPRRVRWVSGSSPGEPRVGTRGGE